VILNQRKLLKIFRIQTSDGLIASGIIYSNEAQRAKRKNEDCTREAENIDENQKRIAA
jgi:hypothetical protein